MKNVPKWHIDTCGSTQSPVAASINNRGGNDEGDKVFYTIPASMFIHRSVMPLPALLATALSSISAT